MSSNPLRDFGLAIGYFTRLPAPTALNWRAEDMSAALKYFPLIGFVVGGLALAVYHAATLLGLPHDLAVGLSVAASVCITGGLHEDGLADAADGLGGGMDAEQCLHIMRDSRIGSFGALALILCLWLKLSALSHLSAVWLGPVLLAGHGVSRWAALCLAFRLPYLRGEGKAKSVLERASWRDGAWSAGLTAPSLFWLPAAAWWALLPAAAVGWWFYRLLRRRLQGYTGDCLGAMQQLTELGFYIAAVALARG